MLEQLKFHSFKSSLKTATLEVSGADSESFLNSQATNDVTGIGDHQFQFNSLLGLQGKVESCFILTRNSKGSYYIITAPSLVESTLNRLEKYLFAEEVELKRIEKNWSIITGPEALVTQGWRNTEHYLPLCVVDEEFESEMLFSLFLIGWDGSFDKQVDKLLNNTFLEYCGVSYSKGCFLGQEVISKIHNNRGAAYAPTLLLHDKQIQSSDVKKYGREIYLSKNYSLIEMKRDFRVNDKIIDIANHNVVVKCLPFTGDYLDDLYYFALDCFQANDTERSKYLLEVIIDYAPTYQDAYESLGVIYGREENFDRAIELMHNLEKIDPSSVMAHTNLSLYYMKVGQIEKAEDHKSQATFKTFEKLGSEAEAKRQVEERKKQEEAERIRREGMFKQVIEIDPEDAMANQGLGQILLERDEFEKSLDHFRKAYANDKKYSVAYLGAGKALIALEKINEAKEVLQLGIEVAAKNGDMMPANEMQSILNKL